MPFGKHTLKRKWTGGVRGGEEENTGGGKGVQRRPTELIFHDTPRGEQGVMTDTTPSVSCSRVSLAELALAALDRRGPSQDIMKRGSREPGTPVWVVV